MGDIALIVRSNMRKFLRCRWSSNRVVEAHIMIHVKVQYEAGDLNGLIEKHHIQVIHFTDIHQRYIID